MQVYYIEFYDKETGVNLKRGTEREFSSLKVALQYMHKKSTNEIGVVYDRKEDILQNINLLYGSGYFSLCKKCGSPFIRGPKYKNFCKDCWEEAHATKICPVCGKSFIIHYQDNECCSKSCAKKLNNNFLNPEILGKIAETNEKKYGFANPWNSPDIQKKCILNRDEEKRCRTLKQVFSVKYAEKRRIKGLKSGSRQISHKEMILADALSRSSIERNRQFIQGKTFEDCVFKNRLRFDFYLPPWQIDGGSEYKEILLEYDGEQHYFPVRFNDITSTQMYHNFITCQVKDWYKDFYAITHNIPLIRIKYSNGETFKDIYKNSYIVGKAQGSDQIFKCFDVLPCDAINVGYGNFTFLIESGVSCSFKCDKENGNQICQNFLLKNQKVVTTLVDHLISMYLKQNLSTSITFQGLEPLDNLKQHLWFIYYFRLVSDDPIYIWTGYTEEECADLIYLIKEKMLWKNIIIKFGRYKPNQEKHYDETLGVMLASDNQYAKRIC